MKWGVRKQKPRSGSSRSSAVKKKISSGVSRVKTSQQKKAAERKEIRSVTKKKKVSKMSDAEIKQRIARLELEKKYKDLSNQQLSTGKKMVSEVATDIMKSSLKNIGTQAMTYVLGTAANKVFSRYVDDNEVVNPKKGQRDKK